MNQYFPPHKRSGSNIKVELDLSSYATKTDLKNITHANVSSFASKKNLANLKTEVDKLDIDKLTPVPNDLATLSSVVKNDVVKKTEFNNLVGKVNNINTTKFTSRTKYVEKNDVEIVVPLKYLSKFWRTLDIQLINCEVSLCLTWSENCVITSKATREADPDVDPAVAGINNPANAVFKITDCKLYVPVVTLSSENDNKLLEQLTTGFKKAIKWNNYRSEMSNQTKNNNLNYLIDPTFTNVNRLFVLSFKNEDDRTSFSKYYVPKVEIKDFNVLIDGKLFF